MDENALWMSLYKHAVSVETKGIILFVKPPFDFRYLHKAFEDVENIIHGQYPGFRKYNTAYHDLRHTIMAS